MPKTRGFCIHLKARASPQGQVASVPLSLWDGECRCHQQLCLSTSIPPGSRELHGLLAWIVLDAAGACRRCWGSPAMQRGRDRGKKRLYLLLCRISRFIYRLLPNPGFVMLIPLSSARTAGLFPACPGSFSLQWKQQVSRTAGARLPAPPAPPGLCLPPAFFFSL